MMIIIKDFLKNTFRQLADFYQNKRGEFFACVAVFILSFFIGIFYNFAYKAPDYFPDGKIFTVKKGDGLYEVSQKLEDANLIRSAFWFRNIVIYLGGESKVLAGVYYFAKPENSVSISNRMISGKTGLVTMKLTFPEGFNIFEMAELLQAKFPSFDKAGFIKLAKDKEGFLFPDTYNFLPNIPPEDVIQIMSNNFDAKILKIDDKISQSKYNLKDIIIMASIVEEEGRTIETRKMISGILWKRIKMGMPLQVDATFKYINGKTSSTLTTSDLKIDSPYNTYVHKGLPPGPISNPGMDSIIATLEPTPSPYLYFLTDENGVMHYAETFDEHVANKKKYLW